MNIINGRLSFCLSVWLSGFLNLHGRGRGWIENSIFSANASCYHLPKSITQQDDGGCDKHWACWLSHKQTPYAVHLQRLILFTFAVKNYCDVSSVQTSHLYSTCAESSETRHPFSFLCVCFTPSPALKKNIPFADVKRN